MNSYISSFLSHFSPSDFVVLRGATEIIRNGDVHFPFRQSSDFLYITGLDMPDLIFSAFGEEIILWRNPISERDILWGHNKLTDSEISDISGIFDIRDYEKFNEYYNEHIGSIISNERIIEIIHAMRLIKKPDEIEKIEQAAKVSKLAFESIEKMIQPGIYEYEIEAEFGRVLCAHHMTEAYPTIVASGKNSCILHYTSHSRKLEQGDVVLIDGGAEYCGYASDLTRTFAIGGEWSPRQKAVYDAVSRVKQFAENTACSGMLFSEFEKKVRDNMNEELIILGLMPTGISDDEKMILSKKYFPHRVSHFLGLDVHDVGSRDIVFSEGMVITIEPGIYITEENLGIRLEDDYLILKSGVKRLS